eukprot:TRINITY_DN11575_c0_g1_i2.p1 TRINITY_DN11575_c0_g1~~TRINITY_DN11575_c0_g1_i2.p1  ORF type:complete len:431 (-),score=112.07 TRINITY_DN11575_c0_g1_i2:154-1446(-)
MPATSTEPPPLVAGNIQPGMEASEALQQNFLQTSADVQIPVQPVVEMPANIPQGLDFNLSANSPNPRTSLTDPYANKANEFAEVETREQVVPSANAQAEERDFDDDFGDFQESSAMPAEKKEETPVIFRLNSGDVEEQKNAKKPEAEVVEHIVIDEPEGNQDREYIEPGITQTHEFGFTNKEEFPNEPPQSQPESTAEPKPQAAWTDFPDINFANEAEGEEKVEEDNQEIDEDNLLDNFLSAITEKMAESSKASPPKEVVKEAPIPQAKPAPVPSRNVFYLSDKSKPMIGDDEKELNTDMDRLKEIEEWLWHSEEIDSYKKLHQHLESLEEMNEFNEKKKIATAQEEFEKAIQYRNKANDAKEKLLPNVVIRSFLKNLEPAETMGELIDKVISLNDISLVLCFTSHSMSFSKDGTCRGLRRQMKRGTTRI